MKLLTEMFEGAGISIHDPKGVSNKGTIKEIILPLPNKNRHSAMMYDSSLWEDVMGPFCAIKYAWLQPSIMQWQDKKLIPKE